MSSLIILYFVLYIISMGVVIKLGFYLQQKKEQKYYKENGGINLNDLTVLIPFRNESKRIEVLLESIVKSEMLPEIIIFIDDHSTDNTVDLIHRHLKGKNYKILTLLGSEIGKKSALRYAIKQVSTKYILTHDADVYFESTYFESISKLDDADLYILPAILEAKNTVQYFYEMDVVLVNAINTGLSGLKRPIIASGANLLFSRSVFNEVDNIASHEHMASGDDTYLLRDFRENDKEVRLISNQFCAVKTETPQSFKEFLNQRLRWIGKTGNIKDHLSTGLAIGQSIFTFAFFALLITTIIQNDWKLFVILLIIKSLLDLVFFASFFTRIGRRITWLFIPLYEVLFPFYTLIILVLMLVYKPKWKERAIYK